MWMDSTVMWVKCSFICLGCWAPFLSRKDDYVAVHWGSIYSIGRQVLSSRIYVGMWATRRRWVTDGHKQGNAPSHSHVRSQCSSNLLLNVLIFFTCKQTFAFQDSQFWVDCVLQRIAEDPSPELGTKIKTKTVLSLSWCSPLQSNKTWSNAFERGCIGSMWFVFKETWLQCGRNISNFIFKWPKL